MRNKLRGAPAVVAVGLVGLHCAGQVEGPSGTAVRQAATYTETIVSLRPDGQHDVRVRVLPVPSTQGDGTGVSRQAISQDTGCASTSLSLWDQARMTGNRICFSGCGQADLYDYCTEGRLPDCTRWALSIRSWESGEDYGAFGDWFDGPSNICSGWCCVGFESFGAWQSDDVASTVVQHATRTKLCESCCTNQGSCSGP